MKLYHYKQYLHLNNNKKHLFTSPVRTREEAERESIEIQRMMYGTESRWL